MVWALEWKQATGKKTPANSVILSERVWYGADNSNTKIKTQQLRTNQTLLSFYLKGQYQLTNHLYAVAAPGIVNLTYFEFQTGLRYVIPLSHVIGIGVEPAYAFGQKAIRREREYAFCTALK